MKTFSVTDVGQRRKINQDYVFVSELPVGALPNLFIVADGMGGHNAGDFASRFVVNTVKELIEKSNGKDVVSVIKDAIQKANTLLRDEALKQEELAGMGTTIVLATVVDGIVHIANVGDSRLYLLSEAELIQITEDHSLVELMVRIGQITKEEARRHPDRNVITRAMGVSGDVQIDFFEYELRAGDLILMCSDGLTSMVEDDEIQAILEKDESIDQRGQMLVDIANDHGGKDNIAVILIEPDTNEVKEC